jgi:hypothetical protein
MQDLAGEDLQQRWQRQETAALEIAARCQIFSVGRAFKDELFRQEVVQQIVLCLCNGGYENSMPMTVKDALLRALAESVYDHPGNAEVAANCGVLNMAGAALEKLKGGDYLTENLLCVTNNVIGMSQTTHSLLRESGIVPCLVRLATSSSGENDGGDIATAALANLSNNPAMRAELIEASRLPCFLIIPPIPFPFSFPVPFRIPSTCCRHPVKEPSGKVRGCCVECLGTRSSNNRLPIQVFASMATDFILCT